MNKKINIKKMINCLVIFVLFFAFSTNVKAENFTCDYEIPMDVKTKAATFDDANTAFYGNYVFRIQYDNSNVTAGFYNTIENKLYSGYEQQFKDSGLTLSDDLSEIKDYVKTNKKCPGTNEVYYWSGESQGGDNQPAWNKGFYLFYTTNSRFDPAKKDVCTRDSLGDPGYYPCGTAVASNTAGNKQSMNIQTCSYALELSAELGTSVVAGGNVKQDVIISYDATTKEFKDITINMTGVQKTPTLGFNWNGTCPEILYVDQNFEKLYNNPNDVPDQNTLNKLGLIKTINIAQDTDLDGKKGCAALGGLTKFIKLFYNLLRYLAPAIIIIFSIIDFVGVVISGENDKLEKAKKRFVTRLLIGVAWLLLPAILEFLLKLAGILEWKESLIDIVLC